MANPPKFATENTTVMMRWIKDFHEKFTSRLGSDSGNTMRSTAWQIEEYLEEHGEFLDAQFIRTLQHSIEKAIQKKDNTDWTVKKSSTSLHGRTTGVNQHVKKPEQKKKAPVSPKLSKQINDRMIKKSAKNDQQTH